MPAITALSAATIGEKRLQIRPCARVCNGGFAALFSCSCHIHVAYRFIDLTTGCFARFEQCSKVQFKPRKRPCEGDVPC